MKTNDNTSKQHKLSPGPGHTRRRLGIRLKHHLRKMRQLRQPFFVTNHARPVLAVDAVIFAIFPNKNELYVFVKRDNTSEQWRLPGRFMHCSSNPNDELWNEDGENWTLEKTLESALNQEWTLYELKDRSDPDSGLIKRKLNYTIKYNEDFKYTLEPMSEINRDSRDKRVVSIPYMSLIYNPAPIPDELTKNVTDDEYSGLAAWIPFSMIHKGAKDREDKRFKDDDAKYLLNHDHGIILKHGFDRLNAFRGRPIGKGMFVKEGETVENETFDITEVLHIYTCVMNTLGMGIDRSNLRKLLQERGILEPIDRRNDRKGGRSRSGGDLCRFNLSKYNEYVENQNFRLNPKGSSTKD